MGHRSKAGAQAAACLFPSTPRQLQGRPAYNITSLALKESGRLFRAENLQLQHLQEGSRTQGSAGEQDEPHQLPSSCLSQVWGITKPVIQQLLPVWATRFLPHCVSLQLTIRWKSLPFVILWFCEQQLLFLFPNLCSSPDSVRLPISCLFGGKAVVSLLPLTSADCSSAGEVPLSRESLCTFLAQLSGFEKVQPIARLFSGMSKSIIHFCISQLRLMNKTALWTYDLVSPMTHGKSLWSGVAQLASTCAVSYGSHLNTSFRYFWKAHSCYHIIKAASYCKVETQPFFLLRLFFCPPWKAVSSASSKRCHQFLLNVDFALLVNLAVLRNSCNFMKKARTTICVGKTYSLNISFQAVSPRCRWAKQTG